LFLYLAGDQKPLGWPPSQPDGGTHRRPEAAPQSQSGAGGKETRDAQTVLECRAGQDSTPPLCLAASEENAMLPAGLFFTAHDRRSPAVEVQGIKLSLKFLSGLLTAAQEAGGEEAVEARKPRLGRLKMQWQCPQFAVFVQNFGQTANLVRCYRNPDDAGLAAKQRRNLHFVFFGFNRTGAIDDHSAGFHQCDGFVQKARLKCRQRRDIAGFLIQAISG